MKLDGLGGTKTSGAIIVVAVGIGGIVTFWMKMADAFDRAVERSAPIQTYATKFAQQEIVNRQVLDRLDVVQSDIRSILGETRRIRRSVVRNGD